MAQIYGKGTFKSEPASPIAFDVIDIDVAKQTARQTTATNDGPLRVVRAVNALHFIEVAAEGYLNVTTLYDNDPLKGATGQ